MRKKRHVRSTFLPQLPIRGDIQNESSCSVLIIRHLKKLHEICLCKQDEALPYSHTVWAATAYMDVFFFDMMKSHPSLLFLNKIPYLWTS